MGQDFVDSCAYDVPFIPQNTSNTCWWAAAQMIIAFHRELKRQSTKAGGAIGQPYANDIIEKRNQAIPWAAVEEWARRNGFRTLYTSPTPAGLVSILRQYGPLWFGGNWARIITPQTPTASGHVVVIRGCTSVGATGRVLVNDPWSGRIEVAYDQLFRTLQSVAEAPFLYLN